MLKGPSDYTEMAQLALEAGLPGRGAEGAGEGLRRQRVQRAAGQGSQHAPAGDRQEDRGQRPGRAAKIEKEAEAATTGDKNVGVGLAYIGYEPVRQGRRPDLQGPHQGRLRNDAEARLLLGIAQLKAGHKDEAVKSFKAVKDPSNPTHRTTGEPLGPARAPGVSQAVGCRPSRTDTFKGRREKSPGPLHSTRAQGMARLPKGAKQHDDQGRRDDARGHAQADDQGRARRTSPPTSCSRARRWCCSRCPGAFTPDLRCQAPAGLRAARRPDPRQGRRYHRLHGGERRVRHERLGQVLRASATRS